MNPMDGDTGEYQPDKSDRRGHQPPHSVRLGTVARSRASPSHATEPRGCDADAVSRGEAQSARRSQDPICKQRRNDSAEIYENVDVAEAGATSTTVREWTIDREQMARRSEGAGQERDVTDRLLRLLRLSPALRLLGGRGACCVAYGEFARHRLGDPARSETRAMPAAASACDATGCDSEAAA